MTEEMIVCDWADCTNEFSYSPPAGWIRFELSRGRGRTDHPKGFICPECWLKMPINMAKNRPWLLEGRRPNKHPHEEAIVKAWDDRYA